jgi:hypothetical protein
LVISIEKLLSDDRDESFGFLDLLSGSDILWVKSGSLSELDNLVFGSLQVLSYELNISDGNSVVLLNALVSFPDFVL